MKMTMIQIIPTNGKRKIFTNYHDACEYINAIEKRKILQSGKKIWSFMRRRYEALYSLYYRNPSLKYFLTQKEKEAVENEMGLVEIIKGNREHITQFLFTPRLDLEPLKRDWCREYCIEHGFSFSELVEE